MKFSLAVLSLFSAADAACTASKEYPLNDATKLSFSGFLPSVKRTLNTGVGNKIVLRGFRFEPMIQEGADGSVQVSAGAPCEGTSVVTPGEDGIDDPSLNPDPENPGDGGSAAAAKYLGWGLASMFLGQTSALAGSTLALSIAVGFLSSAPTAMAQDTISECDLAPIEVEIYIDAMADDLVNMQFKAGDYDICPPETMYWKHHELVFGGYEGCVAERGLYPCASDALGVGLEDGAFYEQSPIFWNGEECITTDFSMENRTMWIQWGHPMDKHEINKRTGINPVVSFPFTRMPYSLFARGGDPTNTQDDSNDARMVAKDILEYIGAWTVEEMADWSVTITEGAEQGMVHLFAAKAMEIAMTTCNRDIRVLMQVPAYGYSTGSAATIANGFSSDFYNSTECACYADDSCKDGTISISANGWLPNTPFPEALGGDGVIYAANSPAATSPWFESMVFPENPSGVIKIGQIPDPNRRVCDGVYLWPMYMGARDFVIPKDEIPDCSAWAFSISKIYSAAARAGWIMYKQDPVMSHDAIVDAIGTSQTLTHGSLSEWTWHGQMQLMETFMEKTIDDPTSWISVYTDLMKEKWDAIIDGFAGCPITTISNDFSGAYVWFVFQEPYLGIQDSTIPSFFRDVLGVRATTYNWGFRGADPADFYGPGYGTNDFTRLQLYRDVNIYEELGRRAKIVCADPDAMIGDNMVSVNQWVASSMATRERRLVEGYASVEERHRHLAEEVPDLTTAQIEHLVNGQIESERQDAAIERCAPEYNTQCLFEEIGTHFDDNF